MKWKIQAEIEALAEDDDSLAKVIHELMEILEGLGIGVRNFRIVPREGESDADRRL